VICGTVKSARTKPPVRVATEASGASPVVETLTLADEGAAVAGTALSASRSIFGAV